MNFEIGEHTIGPGNPAFIIAEMSGNHGGNIQRALEIVRAAKRAGASAIKLQTYTADTITLKSERDDFRIESGPWAEYKCLWDLYNIAHTPWEWHRELFREAKKEGLEIFSSPFDESAVDFLEELGAVAYKIASPEITHIPLLRRVARTGKPVIISTGLANLGDIETALDTLRAGGARNIVVLKCTTAYPAPIDETNLVTIPDYVRRFSVLAGLSDHTEGTVSAIASVALGASVIEKHFTLNDSSTTVDSFFSSAEDEFSALVKNIRDLEKAMGVVSYEIAPSAIESIKGRRSLYVCKDIDEGDRISPENIRCVRPSYGLHPKFYSEIIGRRAKKALRSGDRLDWSVVSDE